MIDRWKKMGQTAIALFPRAYDGWPVMVERDPKDVVPAGFQDAANLSEALLKTCDVFKYFGTDHEIIRLVSVGEAAYILAHNTQRARLAEGGLCVVLGRSVFWTHRCEDLMKGAMATDLQNLLAA